MKHRTRKYESKTKVTLRTTLLLKWRADQELTQKAAARRAGVSTPTYQSAEYGHEIQIVSASRIAKAANVPLSQLEMKSA